MFYMSEDYQKMCNLVSNIPCSPQGVKNVKEIYKEMIGSKRRFASITTLGELVSVLQKRDVINSENIEALETIAHFFEANSITRLLPDKRDYLSPHELSSQSRVLPEVPPDTKSRVYQCIASNIGAKWTFFARALHIPEGYIDELNTQKSISSRVYEILRYHEQSCDPRKWRSSLLEGLRTARRKDLSKQVQDIFDTAPG